MDLPVNDRTSDEHGIQPSDLDELAVVDILSWSAGKFDNSSDNIIQLTG